MDQVLLRDIPVQKDFEIAHLLRVENMEIKETKTGKYYLSMNLGDSTKSFSWCKKWDSSDDEYQKLKKKKVLFVTGKTDVYKDKMSIVCESLAVPENGTETEFLEELVPKTPYDVKFLKKELWRYLRSINNNYIRELCMLFLKETDVNEKLATSVAAVSHHHNYKNGLITHIVRLMYLADAVVDAFNDNMYPNGKYKINKDLIIFGVFCHDLYKINEYSGMEYSDDGKLVPHLPLGAIQANRLMDRIENFPDEIRKQLTHLVLSHHGIIEWGSPVTPMCVESMILHHCDNLAAKIDPMLESLDAMPEGEVWSDRVKVIGNKKAYLGGMLIHQYDDDEVILKDGKVCEKCGENCSVCGVEADETES